MVRSLYTNIDVNEAIETALDYNARHNLECYGLDLQDTRDLLAIMTSP